VRNLDDAVRFMVGYQEARRPDLQRSVLRRLQSKGLLAKQKRGTRVMHFAAGPRWSGSSSNLTSDRNERREMSRSMVDEARAELEAAQSTLDAALHAWDQSVSELWRTSLALTQAQKRVTRAHELLRDALAVADE
jgi:DNA-binding transcriptional regulator GbsR (MarR family)